MRFNIDLLPSEYKSFQRNILVIALALFTVVASCVAIGMLMVRNSSKLLALQTKLQQKNNEKSQVIKEQNQIKGQFPVDRANELKERIDFINANLATPGSSWVAFLSALEATVPERVWIKTLTEMSPGTYKIEGEAGDVGDLLTFIGRLQASKAFDQVFPLTNTTVMREGIRLTGYTLTFHFKGVTP